MAQLDPAGHGVHVEIAVAPIASEYVAAAHGVQGVIPDADQVPAGQGMIKEMNGKCVVDNAALDPKLDIDPCPSCPFELFPQHLILDNVKSAQDFH